MSRVVTTAEILGDPNPERFLPELDALDHRTARVTVGGVELMVVWAYRSGPRISGRFLAEEIRRQLERTAA